MLDAPVEYFIDTGKEPVAVVIYQRGGFFLCHYKIYLISPKGLAAFVCPPTLAVSRQSIFHSPPSSSIGDDWFPMCLKSWTRKHGPDWESYIRWSLMTTYASCRLYQEKYLIMLSDRLGDIDPENEWFCYKRGLNVILFWLVLIDDWRLDDIT